ncbi:molybdenum cofactor biosynthesis protein A [Acidimicrobium ferrooxidans DSM 10331]|uniref:GTP 3',8-cyclase n=1 Tax=Acidimicrobium ferrooxidans (strain DSM 10331 / JCM 15462 / NBRC 103882 / ICP) TaxID=525909 RepID=C7M1B9_ACIFD|nr:GTP 3',8-cyclase MoaA [Acidimicrobium ferrooxidans]ACU54767.1 molybdenum cofactor biosynthesis protein A [Acidimicrobium ferrooxidans DSM 10331]
MDAATPLIDPFGREITDLRVSITDRCNFRCTYCMPEEGMHWLDRGELLSFEEITRIARVMATAFRLQSVRITGGEPTVRAQVPSLIEQLAQVRRPDGTGLELSMTTNGATFALLADDLVSAGLARVNISLDTLRPERFAQITRRTRLERVIEGIDAAIRVGLSPVKLNTVVMRGVNEDELPDLVHFAVDRGIEVRFIEFMPLDGDGHWSPRDVVSEAEMLELLAAHFSFHPLARSSAPATTYELDDGSGRFGVIPTVTHPFCDACDRVRLSADGRLRTCLFALDEHDLRPLLRGGAGDDALAERIVAIVGTKWAGHQIGTVRFRRPSKSMSQIGG